MVSHGYRLPGHAQCRQKKTKRENNSGWRRTDILQLKPPSHTPRVLSNIGLSAALCKHNKAREKSQILPDSPAMIGSLFPDEHRACINVCIHLSINPKAETAVAEVAPASPVTFVKMEAVHHW